MSTGKYCSAYNCTNHDKNSNFSFHQFPKDELLRNKWIAATKRKNFKPSARAVLCSKHFANDAFEIGGIRKRLKKNAIPTVFDFPPHLQAPKAKVRRVLIRSQIQSTSASTSEPQQDKPCEDHSTNNVTHVYPEVDCIPATSTPVEKSQKKIVGFSPTKQKLRRKIKVLQQRLKRRDLRIKKFSDLTDLLKKKLNSSETIIEKLQEHFSGFPLELLISNFKNKQTAKNRRRYSEKMKEFALTLFFYSPKAYRFLRKMDICLPNPSTIRNWLSKFNCSPGLIGEVFQYLKTKVGTNEALKHVNVVFDCMSIRKQLIYDHNERRHYGYVDFGGFNIESHEELASEALVFQIVSLRASFKCVVAYFLISRIDANVLSQLIKTVILKLNEVGVQVHNVTCDGPSTNISALSLLGCKLPESPYFRLPTIDHTICVTLDACHMLKLCRNTLADKGKIESEDGLIEFRFLESLNRLQKSEGYKLANKLSDKHIHFQHKKMNVQLAAQTISSGVADAIEFLGKSNVNFVGSEATVRFIRVMDRLFDYFNSRDPYGKNFKAPIKLSNKLYNDTFLLEVYDYLSKLKIDGISILKHARKTFVLGFLSNIKSIFILQERMLNEVGFRYILTYKFSQDHLELFFSCIRSMGGHNDNPNVRQFQWAIRKLMFRNSVQASNSSNCLSFDPCAQESSVSFIEAKSLTISQHLQENEQADEDEDLTDIRKLCSGLTYYQENVLYYISGFIVKKIVEKIKCEECIALVTKQDYSKPKPYMDFVTSVNMGKLIYPAEDLLKIVYFYHSALRHNVIPLSAHTGVVDRVINSACTNFAGSVFKTHKVLVELGDEAHEIKLIKIVGYLYFKIMLHNMSKSSTIAANPRATGLRQKLHKLILFNNT